MTDVTAALQTAGGEEDSLVLITSPSSTEDEDPCTTILTSLLCGGQSDSPAPWLGNISLTHPVPALSVLQAFVMK